MNLQSFMKLSNQNGQSQVPNQSQFQQNMPQNSLVNHMNQQQMQSAPILFSKQANQPQYSNVAFSPVNSKQVTNMTQDPAKMLQQVDPSKLGELEKQIMSQIQNFVQANSIPQTDNMQMESSQRQNENVNSSQRQQEANEAGGQQTKQLIESLHVLQKLVHGQNSNVAQTQPNPAVQTPVNSNKLVFNPVQPINLNQLGSFQNTSVTAAQIQNQSNGFNGGNQNQGPSVQMPAFKTDAIPSSGDGLGSYPSQQNAEKEKMRSQTQSLLQMETMLGNRITQIGQEIQQLYQQYGQLPFEDQQQYKQQFEDRILELQQENELSRNQLQEARQMMANPLVRQTPTPVPNVADVSDHMKQSQGFCSQANLSGVMGENDSMNPLDTAQQGITQNNFTQIINNYTEASKNGNANKFRSMEQPKPTFKRDTEISPPKNKVVIGAHGAPRLTAQNGNVQRQAPSYQHQNSKAGGSSQGIPQSLSLRSVGSMVSNEPNGSDDFNSHQANPPSGGGSGMNLTNKSQQSVSQEQLQLLLAFQKNQNMNNKQNEQDQLVNLLNVLAQQQQPNQQTTSQNQSLQQDLASKINQLVQQVPANSLQEKLIEKLVQPQQPQVQNNLVQPTNFGQVNQNQLQQALLLQQMQAQQMQTANPPNMVQVPVSGMSAPSRPSKPQLQDNVIRYKDREYQFHGKGIISDEQAMEIFDKLINEKKDPSSSQRTQSQWKDDETHLFQYGLFAYMVKNQKFVEEFNDQDWDQIAEIVPTKDAKKCHKRWLFIQKLGGNKTKWTKKEDELLKTIIQNTGARDWSCLAEKFNDALAEYIQNNKDTDIIASNMVYTARNGKQCRERWLTALDPSINKSSWTIKDDLDFLEKWLQVGNRWREIANLIEGRTESQLKNRFKCILRREHIQQSNADPEQLRAQIVPVLIQNLQSRILSGEDTGKGDENDDEAGEETNERLLEDSDLRAQESQGETNQKQILNSNARPMMTLNPNAVCLDFNNTDLKDFDGDSVME